MGSEDFAYYLKEKPGAFFFIGCRSEEKGINSPHHNPCFDIDTDALNVMMETLLIACFSEY